MPVDDSVHDGEPEAGPVWSARGEEGIEDAAPHVFGHSLAPIRHVELDAGVDPPDGQAQPPAARHGVHGVQDQVHHRLAQRDRLAFHGRDPVDVGDYVDRHPAGFGLVLPERARQRDRVLHHRGQINRTRAVVHARRREALEPSHDVRRPPRRFLDRAEPFAQWALGGARQHELGLPQDDGKELLNSLAMPPAMAPTARAFSVWTS